MPAEAQVVSLDSSDEEDSGGAASAVDYRPLDNQSFWKGGDYEIGSVSFTKTSEDLEHARVHPKFLHSNATSHKWVFGAIAELLDNAVDEIANGATFVRVDKICDEKTNSPALLFEDDGGGMCPDSMRKCMSLGYSSKQSNTAIGQYGNGFKTSTMRLGADVIVFSRSERSGQETQSIGLLSYTMLRRTSKDDVIVPVIDFDLCGSQPKPKIYGSMDCWSSNLQTILAWSPFSSREDLMLQFDSIGSHGTKIIVYNLWTNDEGIYELNFDDDEEDIMLRDEANLGNAPKTSKRYALQSHISYRFRYSLRAYVSFLYLKKFTGFNIILRGKQVDQFSIVKDLKHTEMFTYKPQVRPPSKEFTVDVCIGFIKEAPALDISGFNIYHRNRLIKPFWKVTADGTQKGRGVVGFLEANFIQPAHDKQDFERSLLFTRLETRLKQMVNDYWKNYSHLVGYQMGGTSSDASQLIRDAQAAVASESKGVSERIRRAQVDVMEESLETGRNTIHDAPEMADMVIDADSWSHIGIPLDDRPRDQICDDNIVLFMRCDELKKRCDDKLKKIEQLEKELETTRKERERLSSYLQPLA